MIQWSYLFLALFGSTKIIINLSRLRIYAKLANDIYPYYNFTKQGKERTHEDPIGAF